MKHVFSFVFLLVCLVSTLSANEFHLEYTKIATLGQWKAEITLGTSLERHSAFDLISGFLNKLKRALAHEFRHGFDIPVEVSHLYIYARDGVRLSTFVINPEPFDRKKTILLSRSPYGPSSDQLLDLFLLSSDESEYAVVIQDQRGTAFSGGEFDLWKNESSDGFDTMKFFDKHSDLFPWFNGNVYSAGISADGCSAVTQVLAKPKWLKGQLIIWATGDSHSTLFPGGSFREGLVTGWMTYMGLLTRGETLEKMLTTVKQHEPYSKFYKMISLNDHAKDINFPTIQLSGWWDIFNNEQISLFNELRRHSHRSVRNKHKLVVGPLGHCIFHEIPRLEVFNPVLRHELYGYTVAFKQAQELFSGNLEQLDSFKRFTLFVQGPYHHSRDVKEVRQATDEVHESFWPFGRADDGNFWVHFDEWPSEQSQTYYLSKNSGLTVNKLEVYEGKQTFVYDPEDPVATDGGRSFIIDGLGFRCGSEDQSYFETREDYLTFTSDKLERSIGVCGKVKATLFVSTDRNDTDFVGALTDVYTDKHGKEKSMLVSRGILNMKWRYSNKKPTPTTPYQKYEVTIDMGYTCYLFNKDHKIRFSVTSSSWPLFNVNKNLITEEGLRFLSNNKLQSMDPIPPSYHGYSPLEEADHLQGLVAENSVYFSEEMPSRIELPFVEVDKLNQGKLRRSPFR